MADHTIEQRLHWMEDHGGQECTDCGAGLTWEEDGEYDDGVCHRCATGEPVDDVDV